MPVNPLLKTVYYFKEIENTAILWFKASNQWVLLNQINTRVFKELQQKTQAQQISIQLQTNEKLSQKESVDLINNIKLTIQTLTQKDFPLPNLKIDIPKVLTLKPYFLKEVYYKINAKHFKISYGSVLLYNYIHSPLAHLETTLPPNKYTNYEIFEYNARFALRINNRNAFTTDESSQIKRLFYIELANFLFNKSYTQWLTFMHASAVAHKDTVLAFASESGGGKSTLCGLLENEGFTLIADDFLPIDKEKKNTYSFPALLCVKNQSIQLLKSRNLKPLIEIGNHAYFRTNPKNKRGYYSNLNFLIFVTYNPTSTTLFSEIDLQEALVYYLKEGWVQPTKQGAMLFIQWFSKLKFYKLEYSNNQEAFNAIKSLTDAKK